LIPVNLIRFGSGFIAILDFGFPHPTEGNHQLVSLNCFFGKKVEASGNHFSGAKRSLGQSQFDGASHEPHEKIDDGSQQE
jgi:hypothetical protein